jgi:hypothetical protein
MHIHAYTHTYIHTQVEGCLVESAIAQEAGNPGFSMQCMRVGYFAIDTNSTADKPVLNRIVMLSATVSKK